MSDFIAAIALIVAGFGLGTSWTDSASVDLKHHHGYEDEIQCVTQEQSKCDFTLVKVWNKREAK